MKRIIIVGGGFAGSYAAKKLEKNFEVILIDTKNYFEFTPSVLQTLVEPVHWEKIRIPHQDYLKKTKIIIDLVKNITRHQIQSAKHVLNYDYLILASGSSYTYPIKEENIFLAERGAHLTKYSQKVKTASKILIVGGGLVGVELAAKIREKYPKKELTIVQLRSCCLPRLNQKAQTYAQKYLREKNIKLILGEKVTHAKNNHFITNKNRKIMAELAFFCTNIHPNSEFVQTNFPKMVDEKGFVKVNQNLQLVGLRNIFAAGDVTNTIEEKTAQNAQIQAKVVVQNILHLEKNKPLIKYVSKPRLMVLSLGKWDGLITYHHLSLGGIIPALLKKLIEVKKMKNLRGVKKWNAKLTNVKQISQTSKKAVLQVAAK